MTSGARVLLLRHGEVASHAGDVPVTSASLEVARQAGRELAKRHGGALRVLTGATLRARQTADALREGSLGVLPHDQVTGPVEAFALRNPDIYVAGTRVDLVSTFAALAAQVPGLDEERARGVEFFQGFVDAADRIGWWLAHPSPPGETGDDVVRRLRAFAASLVDPGCAAGVLTVGITHSPLLRSCLRSCTGADPGEPAYLSGVEITVSEDRSLTMAPYTPF